MSSARGRGVATFWTFGLALASSFLASGCAPKACGKSTSFFGGGDESLQVGGDFASDDSPSAGIGVDSNDALSPQVVATHLPVDVALNIEESDLVQVEGVRLYVHSSTRGLSVLDMQDPARPLLLGQNRDVAGEAGELYLRDQSALVLVGESDCVLPAEWGGSFVTAHHQVASVKTSGEFETLQIACLPGQLIASRLIGDRLYILSEYSALGGALSWLIVLDVSQPDVLSLVDVESFSGSAHEFHVTEREVVVAERVASATLQALPIVDPVDPSNDHQPIEMGMGGASSETFEWTPSEAPKVAPQVGMDASSLSTHIRYYSITEAAGTLTARGTLRLSGAPQGRFHYKIFGDSLWVVTFGGRENGSHVYNVALQNPDALSIAGVHSHLAPTEDLHAALFVGERLYIVTYEAIIMRTDPLWVFDLSAKQPALMAELIVPGFSSHLYPLNDETLLAVGRGDRGAGVAVSLFDVANISAPYEKSRLELGSQAAFTEGNLDYRGINLLDLGKRAPVLALPLTQQQQVGQSCTQTSSIEFIEVGEALTHRSTLSLADRPRRTLAMDASVLSVGDVHVTTYDVSQLTAPFVRSTVTIGDENAPLQCIEFSEVLGNSPDALDGGNDNWWGDDVWDGGGEFWDGGSGDNDLTRDEGGCD